MHVRSWNNIKDSLGNFPVRVRNLNEESPLRRFEFDDVRTVLKMLGSAFHGEEVLAPRALPISREKQFWRDSVMQGTEEFAREKQYDKPDMAASSQPRPLHRPPNIRLSPTR